MRLGGTEKTILLRIFRQPGRIEGHYAQYYSDRNAIRRLLKKGLIRRIKVRSEETHRLNYIYLLSDDGLRRVNVELE